MKVSISLPDEDVEFLDDYVREHGVESRSAAIQRAISHLRVSELGDAYAEAWREWSEGGEAEDWEATAADGLAG